MAPDTAKFSFRLVVAGDFDLLWQWHKQPHVKEHWSHYSEFEDLRQRYWERIKDASISCFIVSYEGEPLGYIQKYKAWLAGQGWWPDESDGTWGIDQFIGVSKKLDQGLGTAFVKQFTDEMFVKDACKKIIADPSPSNGRAIRSYEKAGFVNGGLIATPDGDAILMHKLKA